MSESSDSSADALMEPETQPSKQDTHWAVKAFAYVAAAYGIIIFLLWVIQLFLGNEISFIGMIQSTIHLLLIPPLLLLPLALLLRRWWAALALAPAVIAFLISYGVFFLPRSHASEIADSSLRIQTFNIQAPDTGNVDSIIEIIRATDADVVAVQELSPAAADRFSAELQDLYPHQALHPRDQSHAGQGLMSRYPVTSDEYQRHQLEEDVTVLGHQRVAISLAGVEVVFYNVHPVPPYTRSAGFNAAQHTQVLRDVITRANQESAPTIVLGDFNMTDQFPEYRLLQKTFSDAYRDVGDIGFGFSYPHDKWTGVPPFLRLDYIFYSPRFGGITADVGATSGSSDHAPFVAELNLVPVR